MRVVFVIQECKKCTDLPTARKLFIDRNYNLALHHRNCWYRPFTISWTKTWLIVNWKSQIKSSMHDPKTDLPEARRLSIYQNYNLAMCPRVSFVFRRSKRQTSLPKAWVLPFDQFQACSFGAVPCGHRPLTPIGGLSAAASSFNSTWN